MTIEQLEKLVCEYEKIEILFCDNEKITVQFSKAERTEKPEITPQNEMDYNFEVGM